MRKYITEFIGTFFLVLTIGCVVLGITSTAMQLGPIVIGSALMVMIYAGGHISGAHYNPAVTLAVLMRGRITANEAIVYMIVQIVAAAAASFVTMYFIGSENMPKEAGEIHGVAKAVAAEVVGTFALAYVVLNVATAKGTSGNSFYGLAIGFTVMVMAFIMGSYSGGAFNPAVAVGITIMKLSSWSQIWIYLLGCFGGAALAAIVFKINNPEDK